MFRAVGRQKQDRIQFVKHIYLSYECIISGFCPDLFFNTQNLRYFLNNKKKDWRNLTTVCFGLTILIKFQETISSLLFIRQISKPVLAMDSAVRCRSSRQPFLGFHRLELAKIAFSCHPDSDIPVRYV